MAGRLRVGERLPDVYPRLYRTLGEDPQAVAAFFPRPPVGAAAWAERAREVDLLWRDPQAQARRRQVAAALAALLQPLGPTAAQQENLHRLAQPETLVVVTGQQAGLLLGPLYTVYKALGAVVLAGTAARALGRPVVPVFWVASEDHDFSEVSRLRLAGPDGTLLTLALGGSGEFRSAGDIPVPPQARHLLGELEGLFPPSQAGAGIARALRAGLQGRTSLAGWFTRQLHELLGPTGLLVYDPMHPALRAAAAPVLAGAVQRAAASSAAIAEAGRRLQAEGFAPGLELDADHVHLFVYHQGRRLALHLSGERVHTRGGEVDLPVGELAARVQRDPAGFSPNVALRPVVQDFTLPVLAQVAGPGEVAYLAQLGGVFALWDRALPLVVPRPGASVALPEDDEALRRAGIGVAALRADPTAAIEEAVAAVSPLDLDALFGAERGLLESRYARLEGVLEAISPHLPAIVRANGERVQAQLAYLERKAHQHRRRARRDLTAALRAAAGRLFPGGALQERNSCLYAYLFRWGAEFLWALHEAIAAVGPGGADAVGCSWVQHPVLHWEPEA